MNIWTFIGVLGRDASVKATQTGLSVCEFTVAVNDGYGDKKKTIWVECALFGKRAEGQLPSYLTKGVKVGVSGKLSHECFKLKSGEDRYVLKVNVSDLDLLGSKPTQMNQPQQPTQHEQAKANGYQAEQLDDDIPF